MRLTPGSLVAIGLVGCSSTAEGPGDRAAFLESLTADLSEAASHCAEIVDPSLRGECRSGVAGRLAAAGRVDEGMVLCDGVTESMWLEECVFLTLERSEAWGPALATRCARAGRFATSCVDHLFHRHAERDPEVPRGIGDELALTAAIEVLVPLYYPDAEARFEASRVERGVSKAIGSRWEHQPFDLSLCGALTQERCAQAYYASIRRRVQIRDVVAVCQSEPTLSSVQAQGFSGWTPESAQVALRVWRRVCREGLDRPVAAP